MKLYHRDVYMPPLNLKDQTVPVRYTIHAMNEACNDPYADEIVMPAEINLAKVDIFEIGVERGEVAKVAFRMDYDVEFDLCMVVTIPELRVKTLWLNCKDDDHNTLDPTRYEQR